MLEGWAVRADMTRELSRVLVSTATGMQTAILPEDSAGQRVRMSIARIAELQWLVDAVCYAFQQL